ncbi:MAG: anti-sigma factor [Chloroflexota bacterium]
MIDRDPFIHLVAGRELGGLDDAEAIELDRHLVGCARCAAEARAFDGTMAALALLVPARRPPESLQGSIMTAIRAVTPLPDPMPSWPAAVMGGERSSWRRWALGSWPRPLAAGLAAALVIVSLGAWRGVVNLQSELNQQRASVAAAQRQLALQGAAMAVALDPRHVAAALAPEAIAPAAVAQVVYRPGTDLAYLIADHVPATPAGKVYQLWYADGAGVHPLATVAFDGNGALIVPFGVDLGGKAAAMVTLESVGGAQGTPGPQVVFGDLPRP